MSTESTKTIRGRISHKHGTEEHWLKSVFKQDENGIITNELLDNPFCPLEGELIIYDPDDVYEHPRTKYGAKDTNGELIPVHLLPWASGCDESIGLEFELISEEEYSVKKAGSCTDTDIVIPKGYCGKPITQLGDCSLENLSDNVVSVILPNTIELVGSMAFSYSPSLKSVFIPKSVTNFSFCFEGCENVTIFCEADVQPEGWDDDWNYWDRPVVWGFAGDFAAVNNKLEKIIWGPELKYTSNGDGTCYISEIGTCTDTDIVIPKTYKGMVVTSIGDSVFKNYSSLTSIVIPDSVTNIGPYAFSGCSNLTSIVIPDSVTSIGDNAFEECGSLTNVVISDSVTSIGDYVFYKCANLASIIIPDGVISIDWNAFYYCTSLISIVIPNSVTIIGNRAFAYCTNLNNVYYKGSEENWNNIRIDSNNDHLINATIHYDYVDDFIGINEKIEGLYDKIGEGGEIDTSTLATVDKIKSVSTTGLNRSILGTNDGIKWNDTLTAFDSERFLGNRLANSDILKHVPIAAGDNVTFTVDENNQVVKINAKPLIPITYSELKTLRDNSQLVPGTFYRITDYQCTTTQTDTRAMDHRFDIIVQALDVNKLSENASATQHEEDTYFADANLAAWELKYSLDNNTSRFWWANAENGKGVIYYMKDENNNECPYDFKNIQFKRCRVVKCEKVPNYVGQYIATNGGGGDLDIEFSYEIKYDTDDFIWCYTFTIVIEGMITDYSMFKESPLVENNNVKAYSRYDRQMLNNNVFISPRGFEAEDDSHFFGNNIVDGVYNTISVDYYIMGNSIIGVSNTLSSYGVERVYIKGSENLFCEDVYNVILPDCDLNIFAGFAKNLSFGPGCSNNYFGKIIDSSFGCGCVNIGFYYSDYTPWYYLRRLTVGNGCRGIKLLNDEEGGHVNYVQDITISNGIQQKELQVSRNAAPVVFEAANTTHIILD